VNFRTLDLNLLRIFDTVMSEGSLTRAAEVLAITQPAASHALKRLHQAVGEALFVRNAYGMTPTPKAEVLWPQVRAALAGLQQALAPGAFDPRTQDFVRRAIAHHREVGTELQRADKLGLGAAQAAFDRD